MVDGNVLTIIQFPKKFDMGFIRNENVQYFALAFYWYSYQPIIGKVRMVDRVIMLNDSCVMYTVTLVPFLVFSLFHMFAYIPNGIAPTFFPNNDNPMVAQACQSIKHYTDSNHETAMQLAAYVEVIGVMGQLVLGVAR